MCCSIEIVAFAQENGANPCFRLNDLFGVVAEHASLVRQRIGEYVQGLLNTPCFRSVDARVAATDLILLDLGEERG